MFGRPEWFGEKSVAWRLKPICWQGWTYAVVWLGVLALPIFCLLATSRVTEALIWLVVAGGTMVWDTRQMLRSNRAKTAEQDVLYITADDDDAPLGTQNYEFQVRR